VSQSSPERLGLTPFKVGKIRQLYSVGDDHLLMVASDKISAFDVVMDQAIPEKGRVLTAMTSFWCEELSHVAVGSLVSCDPSVIEHSVPGFKEASDLHGRTMLVRSAEMLSLECIVRGYLAGQAFEEYQQHGTIHTMAAPPGLGLGEQLPAPMFTPSTKAAEGHDLNIGLEEAAEIVGKKRLEEAQELCLNLYKAGAKRCADAGLILADTKFELGIIDGQLVLCDEVITPDSSRIWPADEVVIGRSPPAFDKQPFRDWLSAQPWEKSPPPPTLPDDVIATTSARYQAAYERVTNRALEDWYGRSS
jgi:phosphoribosylaminoimidazole-succinocarboxamide synthase